MIDRTVDMSSNRAGCGRAVAAALVAAICMWAGRAEGAVALGSGGWSAGTAASATVSITKTADAGSNRLLVVTLTTVVAANSTGAITCSGNYGTRTAFTTAVTSDTTSSNRVKACILTLPETEIAAATNSTLSATIAVSGATISGTSMKAAFYTGVNQTTSVSASTGNGSTTGTVAYTAAVSVNANGAHVVGIGGRAAATQGTLTPTPSANTFTQQGTAGFTNASIDVWQRLIGAANESTSVSYTWGGTSAGSAIVGVALNPIPTVTIGNGSAEPANSSIYSGQVGAIDAFSVQTDTGTATITAVTVGLTAGATSLTNLFINSAANCLGTTYGTLSAGLVVGNNLINLTTNISATTTSGTTDLYVCGTASGTAGTVTGTVASVTAAGYASTDSDTTNATLTVTLPPVITIGNGSAEPPNASITAGTTAALDAFSVQTNLSTATITAVVIGITAGNSGLSGLSINSAQSCLGTSYGSLGGTIATGNNTVPLTTSIVATTTSGTTNLYVCATGALVAANTTVTGNVASVTAGAATFTDSDTTNATLTVTPFTGGVLVLADPGTQPGASTQPPGATGILVLKMRLSATGQNLTLEQIRVNSTGTALPDVDILGLQLWEGTALVGNSVWSSTLSHYVFYPRLPFIAGAAARDFSIYASVAQGATQGRTFTASSTSNAPADFVVSSGAFVQSGVTVSGAGALTIGAGTGGGSTIANAPAVSIVNPGPGGAVSGSFRVQVRVYVPPQNGIASVTANSVQVATNSTFTANLVTLQATTQTAYQNSAGSPLVLVSTIYETPAATPYSLTPGAYTLYARASTAAGTTVSDPVMITVAAARKGDGALLVRDNSSQLCTDCHALATHASETTSTTYGNWTTNCRDCHQPHSTTNAYLVKPQITPPGVGGYQSSKSVQFYNTTGDAPGSYVNSAAPAGGPFGPCQACHTRTQNPSTLASRWRNSGNTDTHFVGAATTDCKGCHSHTAGFKAVESTGGLVDPTKFSNCSTCHTSIFNGMNGVTAKVTKHTLGATVGTNDFYQDTAVTWASPLTGNAPASRSCVNMCHQDHVHNQVGGTSHSYNAHTDATSQTTRAVTRNATTGVITGLPVGAAGPATTDFDNAAANGGMCLSCHRNPINAGSPTIDKVAYNTSAHNYSANASGTWTYSIHDGTKFNRNCTKCHADRNDTWPDDNGIPFGAVHFSGYPKLLAGSKNPNSAPATFVCYNCHGNGTTGTNLSGKDLATIFADANKHPAEADNIHDTALEAADTFQSGRFAGANRHVNCVDCHEPHEAGNTLHTPGTNTLGAASPLRGMSGVTFTSGATNWLGLASVNWPAVPSTNYAWVLATTGVTSEAQICFKCHSSWATATAPTGLSGMTETNVALDFNTGNNAYHPVLAATATANRLNATQLCTSTAATGCATSSGSWAPGAVMTCSDCHGSDANASGAQGPHGSAGKFILKGPQTAWPVNPTTNALFANPTVAQPTGTSGLFCLNCHPQTNSTATNNVHQDGNHASNTIYCITCHTAVPHGSKVTRFLAPGNAPTPYKYYSYGGGPAQPTQWVMGICGTRPSYTTWNTNNCNASCTTTHNCTPIAQTW